MRQNIVPTGDGWLTYKCTLKDLSFNLGIGTIFNSPPWSERPMYNSDSIQTEKHSSSMDSLLKSNTSFNHGQGKKINKRNNAMKNKAKYKTKPTNKTDIKEPTCFYSLLTLKNITNITFIGFFSSVYYLSVSMARTMTFLSTFITSLPDCIHSPLLSSVLLTSLC